MRALLATITLLTLTLTHANNYTSAEIRDVIANDTNGTTTQCLAPSEKADVACYNQDSSIRNTKLLLEITLNKYNDINWTSPWQIDGQLQSRFATLKTNTGTQTIVIILAPINTYETHVVIFQTPN